MTAQQAAVDAAITESLAEPSAGVARVDVGDETTLETAWGLADRRHDIAMAPTHRVAIASGGKGFTALAVMSLIVDGTLTLDTTARSILGDDLPLIDDRVTVKHLLAHRSGIGEYLDDDADLSEYLLHGPMSGYVSPEDYLGVLDGHESIFEPDSRFSYCNGGFVVLALLAQRASGIEFHELVRERVIRPAGLTATDYLRSDRLLGDAAVGYVQVDGAWRTNVFHLPVIGGGDGGIYTTAADLQRFWRALLAGRIVPADAVTEMTSMVTPPDESGEGVGYGLGFWVPGPGRVRLVGMDAGSSFASEHDVATGTTASVLATTGMGAWGVGEALGIDNL